MENKQQLSLRKQVSLPPGAPISSISEDVVLTIVDEEEVGLPTERKWYNNEVLVENDERSEDDVDDSSSSGEDVEDEVKEEEVTSPIKSKKSKATVLSLFRFTNTFDIILLVIGTVCAMFHGASYPCIYIIFGSVTDPFVDYANKFNTANLSRCSSGGRNSSAISFESLNMNIMWFCLISVAVMISSGVQIYCFMLVSSRIGRKIKMEFFKSILHLDMSFFDMTSPGAVSAKLDENTRKIQSGISDRLSISISMFARTFSGLIISFVYNWKISLVFLAITPLISISSAVAIRITTRFNQKEVSDYAKAGGVAEETLSSIKTVKAFAMEKSEKEKYDILLEHGKKSAINRSVVNGISMGFTWMILNCIYGISFWYGYTLVEKNEITVGRLLTCFSSMLIASNAFGRGYSLLQNTLMAGSAIDDLLSVIDGNNLIGSGRNEGHKPEMVLGEIEFKDVRFSYPARTDVKVLKRASFKVESGQTVAICGRSGCGKSTFVALLQRMYDPEGGTITLDGNELKTLNVSWLRRNIGVVSQEPQLFNTTILENIKAGCEDATFEDISRAAKEANAYGFIMDFPKAFDTMVGESGTQLSGGQKQRIAIARAIVGNPKILLLDEATSALDSNSESIVQSVIASGKPGRTTIVIAHRLNSIKNADVIFSMDDGKIVERGSHSELINIENGVYSTLVHLQRLSTRLSTFGESWRNKSSNRSVYGDHRKLSMRSSNISSRRRSTLASIVEHDNVFDEIECKDVKHSISVVQLPRVPVSKIVATNSNLMPYVVLGCFLSLINGGLQPTFALMYAGFIQSISLPQQSERKYNIMVYCAMFAVLGVITMILYCMLSWAFAMSRENMTKKFRSQIFETFVNEQCEYFDDCCHSIGSLTRRLSGDAPNISVIAGEYLGHVLSVGGAIVSGVIIAFVYSWHMGLVMVGFLPLMLCGGYFFVKIGSGNKSLESSDSLEKAEGIATEAISSIRTLCSFCLQDEISKKYAEAQNGHYKEISRRSIFGGMGYGYSQAILLFRFPVMIALGAYLIVNNCLPIESLFVVLMATFISVLFASQSTASMPDYGAAKTSCRKVYHVLENCQQEHNNMDGGEKMVYVLDNFSGSISLFRCSFSYPSRPNSPVLKQISLRVKPNQTLAIVGESGCGKSTIIQLLLRFYEANSGKIMFDETPIDALDLTWLRQQFGWVSQEPMLFNRSIFENIQYGNADASYEDVIQAAKEANIHDFVEKLPQKYTTIIGSKGTQISGGQKQRIAIARALVRKPKVLLLDEATSALDSESEKVVQKTLRHASTGRTCIVVAHRLSTIKHAHNIVVVSDGKISESGTHRELMSRQGHYYDLFMEQTKKD